MQKILFFVDITFTEHIQYPPNSRTHTPRQIQDTEIHISPIPLPMNYLHTAVDLIHNIHISILHPIRTRLLHNHWNRSILPNIPRPLQEHRE
jgi:hypothetical protein